MGAFVFKVYCLLLIIAALCYVQGIYCRKYALLTISLDIGIVMLINSGKVRDLNSNLTSQQVFSKKECQ